MASIIMKRGTTSEISNTPISDGQILFETDTKNIYIDEGSNRIEYRATTIDIDSKLSTTSENPVQNKVITTNINDINTKLNSINPQADSGYVIIGDTLIQWGTAIYDTQGNNNYVQKNISFPMSFADSDYTVSLSLNYSVSTSAYHDAIATYASKTQNGFDARAISKSGGFTTANFPKKDIGVNWLAIGKRAL